MYYASISLTLLAAIAAIHLLIKIQKDQAHSIYKWMGYFILTITFLLLFCELARGVRKMVANDHRRKHEMYRRHSGSMGIYSNDDCKGCNANVSRDEDDDDEKEHVMTTDSLK